MLSCHKIALLLTAVAITAGTQASASQILSAVESRQTGGGNAAAEPRDAPSSNQAGQLVSTTFGGADSRAYTDFGVNKIFSSGTATNRQYATSNWLDSYTVAGAAGTNVTVSFTFSIDGNIALANDPYAGPGGTQGRVNFSVYALRGANWELGGTPQSYSLANPLVQAVANGDNYTTPWVRQTASPGGFLAAFQPNTFDGVYYYQKVAGAPGPLSSRIRYDENTDTYYNTSLSVGSGGTNEILDVFTATTYRRFINGVPTTPLIPIAQVPQLVAARANLDANRTFPILDTARLCDNIFNQCANGAYPGSDLTLSFTMLAGSTFTLVSSLHSFDLYDEGTVDFFHTAKVTGISVSPGGSLTSDSGSLTALPGGGYGYPAVTAGVPEPASWAMLVAGFGLVGAMKRRRRLPIIAG